MLALVFSCCGLRHRPLDPPDERTPLIPHADDTPTRVPLSSSSSPFPAHTTSSPQPRVIDNQKLKERLGSVVRSKEGKMVNVNAQFPFNLHNHDHSSSSSRNVSGGTLPGSRAASPSPPRHLHKSASTTSFRPDGEDVHYLPLAVNPPVLNVRLVKSARSLHNARGRSQRSCDPACRTPQSELAPDEEHTPRALPPAALGRTAHLPLDSETPPHHAEDFNLHDAGAVARSWGD